MMTIKRLPNMQRKAAIPQRKPLTSKHAAFNKRPCPSPLANAAANPF